MRRAYSIMPSNNYKFNDPLKGNGSFFQGGILGTVDNFLNFLGFGNTDASSNIWDELTGYNSQMREFEQQEALLQKEQEFAAQQADPVFRMQQMRKAGINPNTAAQGIAGAAPASSPSAPSVSNATSAPAAGLSAASSALSALTSGASDVVDAVTKASQNQPIIDNLRADYEKKLLEQGLTQEQINALFIDNKYREQNAISDLLTKSLNQDNLRQQYKVLDSTYHLQLQQIDKEIEEIKMMESQIAINDYNAKYLDALQRKTKLEADWQSTRNDFFAKNGFDMQNSTIDAILAQMIVADKDIAQFCQGYAQYHSAVSTATSNAAANATWLSRPSSQYEIIAQAAHGLQQQGNPVHDIITSGVHSGRELLNRVQRDTAAAAEFEEQYSEARNELYRVYRDARRAYHDSRGMSDVARAELKRKMENARQEYDNFTREIFSNRLVDEINRGLSQ